MLLLAISPEMFFNHLKCKIVISGKVQKMHEFGNFQVLSSKLQLTLPVNVTS